MAPIYGLQKTEDMKKLMLLAFAGIVLVYSANAQTQNQHDNRKIEHNRQKGKKWQKENLTAEQRQKVMAEREKFKSEREAIKNDATLSEVQKKEKMRELSQQQRNEVNGILTPEQRKKFGAYKQDSTHSTTQRGRDLNLSDSQKTQMTEIRKNYVSESQKIKENTALSEDQKKDQMKKLREKQHKEMRAVLTKEQQEKMKSFQRNR